MNLLIIPGFEPSAEAYAPAVAVLDLTHRLFLARGLSAQADVDLYVAVVGGHGRPDGWRPRPCGTSPAPARPIS